MTAKLKRVSKTAVAEGPVGTTDYDHELVATQLRGRRFDIGETIPLTV